jgi:hypothetical protein
MLRPRKRLGRCYELALKHMLSEERFADWRLVHGEVRGPDGSMIGHAWLEADQTVFDATLNEFIPSWEYRNRVAARALSTYSRKEAARAGVDQGHYGPWPDQTVSAP